MDALNAVKNSWSSFSLPRGEVKASSEDFLGISSFLRQLNQDQSSETLRKIGEPQPKITMEDMFPIKMEMNKLSPLSNYRDNYNLSRDQKK